MSSDAQPTTSLNGVLERIIYFNEENAYCVAELRPTDETRSVTVLGPMPGVQCGETLHLSGEWTRHPKHGDQFKLSDFKSELPASVHGIRQYLGSGMVRGIGKTYAQKIVDHFGADTLRVISEDSARLREVPGIGRERAKSIKAAWDEQRAVRDVMMFLQTYGVTTRQCVRLVKKYGAGARRVLQEDPYRLVDDIERIGFKTADKLALNLGFPTHSDERVDAGILHAMNEFEEEGHTFAPEEALAERATQRLGVRRGLVAARLRELAGDERLAMADIDDPSSGARERACQLPRTAAAEKRAAEAIARLAGGPSGLPPIKIGAAVEWAENRAGIAFTDQQREAVRGSLEAKVSVLTGGPGTGKTTILRALVDILRAKRLRVFLASPTGRAAQRLAEAAGSEASTIHRLLKHDPASGGFVHHADNPLPCDALIVDESSMLDTRLASQLLPAAPSPAHLLLVGDADQLPSVGPGNVFGDLAQAPQARVTRLETIFRQGDKSGIVVTAHNIRRGEADPGRVVRSLRDLEPEHDVHFIETESAERCAEAVAYLSLDYIPKAYGLDAVTETQTLSPMHRGAAGVAELNRALQEKLNPPETARQRLAEAEGYRPGSQRHFREKTRRPLPHEIEHGGRAFRLGDKVIQTRNNYDLNVFNGDTGVIRAIAPDANGLTLRFNGEDVELARGDLSDVQLAYAITIHKSQGSEYPAVIIPLLKQHFLLLQRNLIYTAITRARQKAFLVGSREAYAMAVRNNETQARRTRLSARLRETAAPAK